MSWETVCVPIFLYVNCQFDKKYANFAWYLDDILNNDWRHRHIGRQRQQEYEEHKQGNEQER